MAEVLISWRTADGAEHDERWPSVERFRLWALAQGLRCTWTAYCQPQSTVDGTSDDDQAEDDEEWVVIDLGAL